MRAHEAFWVYLAEHGGTSAKNHVEKRKAEGPATDPRWLVTRAGLKAREAWLALPRQERAAYMRATPDASFPAGNDTGILEDRRGGRAAALSVHRFVAAMEATRLQPLASAAASNGFSQDESAWIRLQVEPFRRVPLDQPQWRRLLQAFVRRYPQRSRQPTLREYKSHVVRLEEERTAKELRRIDAKCPAQPTLHNVTHEFKVQTKRVKAKAVIKQEQHERRRTLVSVFEDDEVKEEEADNEEEIEAVAEGGEEEEADTEEDEAVRGVIARGVMMPEPTHPAVALARELRQDLRKSRMEAEQWKLQYEAAQAMAEVRLGQLQAARTALREAERRLRERRAALPVRAAPAVASASPAVATPHVATTASQSGAALTLVINVHLDRGAVSQGEDSQQAPP